MADRAESLLPPISLIEIEILGVFGIEASLGIGGGDKRSAI